MSYDFAIISSGKSSFPVFERMAGARKTSIWATPLSNAIILHMSTAAPFTTACLQSGKGCAWAHRPGNSQSSSYLAQEVHICLATVLTLRSLRYLELYLLGDSQACIGRRIIRTRRQMRAFLIFELAEEIPVRRRSVGNGFGGPPQAAVHTLAPTWGTFPSANSSMSHSWSVFLFTFA